MGRGAAPNAEPKELVAATANPAKLAEIESILGDRVRLLPRPTYVADVVEDAPTLEGNAALKADAIWDATGLPAVADDTGLEVVALDGAPGVHSARYGGEQCVDADNVERLLAELSSVEDRRARFRTVAMIRHAAGRIVVEGICEGRIALSARGAGGFGYDPVFVPDDGDGRSFAEMSAAEKHALSHRGKAFRLLATRLSELGR